MTPTVLDFGVSDRVERHHRSVLRQLGELVEELSYEVVCGACDCSRSNLIDALRDRDRHFRVEWLIAIHTIASPEQRARLEAALFPPTRPLTAEERLARLEQRVAAELGVAGLRIVEENRK